MTAFPAARDGLLAVFNDSDVLGAPDVLISNGPWLRRPDANDSLVVGWLSAETSTVEWSSSPASLASNDTTEVFTVQCIILCWRGDTNFTIAQDRADAMIEAARVAIQQDPTLGDAVSYAELFTMRLVNWELEKGVEVYIQFGVRITVF